MLSMGAEVADLGLPLDTLDMTSEGEAIAVD